MEVTIDSLFARIGRLTVEGDELRSQLAAAETGRDAAAARAAQMDAELGRARAEADRLREEIGQLHMRLNSWPHNGPGARDPFHPDEAAARTAEQMARILATARTGPPALLSEPPAPGPVTHLADFHPADLAGTHV